MSSSNNYELKMSLQELRKHIDLKKQQWEHMFSTNCYAYALGLDIEESDISGYAYSPGVIGKSSIFLPDYRSFAYSQLLENLYLDFEALGIDFREISPSEQIEQEAWKIALFTSRVAFSCDEEWVDDYHFLRQNVDGIWYHKNGWSDEVRNTDSHREIITNPEECYLKSYKYQKCYCLRKMPM